MGRAPCCDKNGLKKGPWIPEEDQKLIDYIQKHGYGNWRTLPNNAGLQRCGKSCRLRWTNYLKPDIKRGRFSFEEEETIIHLHSRLGNKWSTIAARLPGRTDNEIKNYWNTQIRKKLLRMGIDPVTHGPRLDLLELFSHIYGLSSLSNSPQMNLSRLLAIQPLVNPELLRLATSVLYNQCENDHNFVSHENGQENQLCNNPQVQNQYHHPLVQPNKLQEMPTCTTLTATSSNVVHFSNYKTQLTHPNANQNFGLNQEWQGDHGLAASNSAEDYVTYKSCYQSHDQTGILDPSTLTLICNNRDQNFSFVPVLSTPSSSSSPAPLNSNSTYINGGSSTEDERESYSSMLKYEIREILEASNNFMQLHDQPL